MQPLPVPTTALASDTHPVLSVQNEATLLRSRSTTRSYVLHVAPGYWACEPRLYHLECVSLLSAGFQVQLAAHELPTDNLDSRLQFYSLGPFGYSLSWRMFTRFKRDRKAFNFAYHSNASLLHFHSLEFITWASWLRRKIRKPVIFDCREDFESWARQRAGIPNLLRPLIARSIRMQLHLAARCCDAVIVADEGTARLLEPHARRLIVLHNFPRLEFFPKLKVASNDRPYDLIYHGSVPKYHLDAILQIDTALTSRGVSAVWRIFGMIAEEPWFRAQLEQRGIADRFMISGLIPHAQISAELRKAKIGIIPLPNLPKFQNNIPQKLFEFMALEIPVVMSDLPPSRPFVSGDGCAFRVPPDDYSAYADAIVRLLADSSLRSQMGAEGRRRVEQQFNWAKEFPKLVGLYEELMTQ